jgi:predicted transcriptional regulator
MVLTGEMLSSFEESQSQKNIVKVKIQEGENTLKAYNHNVGDTLPKRQFFGLKDVGQIVKKVDSLKEDTKKERKQKIDLAAIRSALNDIRIETEGFNGEDQD